MIYIGGIGIASSDSFPCEIQARIGIEHAAENAECDRKHRHETEIKRLKSDLTEREKQSHAHKEEHDRKKEEQHREKRYRHA